MDVKKFKCSIALLEMNKYQLGSSLLETFKNILSHYGLNFGLLKINGKTFEVKEEIYAEEIPAEILQKV
jgi:hypothetical protein